MLYTCGCTVRKSTDKVKESLLAAFAADPYVAYEQFVSRNLCSGEMPCVYLAELRRLAFLICGVSNKVLVCAFVAWLPEDVRQLLRAGSRMEALNLDQVLPRARTMIRNERVPGSSAACLVSVGRLDARTASNE